MIPLDYITRWRAHAPWAIDAQVEQDLVISRALVEIFRVPDLARRLAFRGGTALYKLHLTPPPRYSEDIDLVQVRSEPIGDTLDQMRSVLDPWLGEPRWELKEGTVNLVYRFESEDEPPLKLRLKIEINTREHFTELGLESVPFEVDSPWFGGSAEVNTYALDELLGTKLRALYQRKKGRDLFDLWHALETATYGARLLPSIHDRGRSLRHPCTVRGESPREAQAARFPRGHGSAASPRTFVGSRHGIEHRLGALRRPPAGRPMEGVGVIG